MEVGVQETPISIYEYIILSLTDSNLPIPKNNKHPVENIMNEIISCRFLKGFEFLKEFEKCGILVY